jgi:hypothetical protein
MLFYQVCENGKVQQLVFQLPRQEMFSWRISKKAEFMVLMEKQWGCTVFLTVRRGPVQEKQTEWCMLRHIILGQQRLVITLQSVYK